MHSNPEWGYQLDFSSLEEGYLHEFCGQHNIAGAICPNCSKPLIRILSLSTNDNQLKISSEKEIIHLLYCWTCSIPFGIFSYRIQASGSIEIMEVPPAYEWAFGPEGPYSSYTGKFPLHKVRLAPLSKQEQQKQQAAQTDEDLALDLMGDQKHQIGGYPIIANSQDIVCPICSKPSPLLAVICDDATGNKPGEVPEKDSFTGNPDTQMVFHFCCNCSVVSAYHSNS